MSSPVGVIVAVTTRPGRGAEQVALFAEIAPRVRAEDGCLEYTLHPVVGDPDRFVILEWWASAAALEAHGTTAHMASADEKARSFRAGPAQATLIEPAR